MDYNNSIHQKNSPNQNESFKIKLTVVVSTLKLE
jgi:hypothetical protein